MTSSTPGDDGSPLGIDPDKATLTADLFESYAGYAAEELTSLSEEDRWQSDVDAGSAYRTAAQWALLDDPRRTRQLLLAAADHFTSTYGYAAFLRAVAGEPPRDAVADARRLRVLNPPTDWLGVRLAPMSPDDADLENMAPDERWPGLAHPQQQAYLLLALAGERELPVQALNDVLAACRNLGRRHEGHPIGSIGLPLWRYWRAAEQLLFGDVISVAREILVPLDHRYTDAVTGAQSNTYLWNNAASPVDVVDLEIVGLTVLAVRRFGAAEVRDAVEEGRMSDAMTSLIDHGIRLAEEGR